MGGDGVDVVLKQIDIVEDAVVYALQDVVGRIAVSRHFECVVDESVAQWFHLCH